jgi:hypothetical protein
MLITITLEGALSTLSLIKLVATNAFINLVT